jgi:hypothetical protein
MPEKTKVVEREIEFWRASAIINGKRVPRSPRDPEISAKDDLRSVDTLLAWMRRKSDTAMILGRERLDKCLSKTSSANYFIPVNDATAIGDLKAF